MYINFFLSRLLYVLIIEPKFHSFSCQIPFHPRRTQQTNAWKPRDEKFHAIPNSLAFMSKNFIGNTYVYTMFIYHLKNSTTCPEPNFVTFLFQYKQNFKHSLYLIIFPFVYTTGGNIRYVNSHFHNRPCTYTHSIPEIYWVEWVFWQIPGRNICLRIKIVILWKS